MDQRQRGDGGKSEWLSSGAPRRDRGSAAQLEGLAYLSVNVYKTGWVTAQLFFGTWLFPLGYLVYESESPVPGRPSGA